MTKMIKRSVSILLTIVIISSLFTNIPMTAYAESDGSLVDEKLVDQLTTFYDDDETRVRSDLEAMYASGLIDEEGSMVSLDICEDGTPVELNALVERISNGETTGKLTVNGNETTSDQILKISQMKAALEVAQLLDEDIEVTDEHAENLKSLLTGVRNGDIDIEEAIKTGKLSAAKAATSLAALGADPDYDLPDSSTGTGNLTLNADGTSYTGSYISGSEYEEQHAFTLDDPANKSYYTDSNSNSGDFSGGVITFEASTDNGATWTSLSNGDGVSIPHDFWISYSSGANSYNRDAESTPPIVLIRATLNEPQPLPVSCDTMFSGGGYYVVTKEIISPDSPYAYLAWNTDRNYSNQTLSWDANQAGSKMIELYPGWYQYRDKVHYGVVSYMFNAGNVKNAAFGDGNGETWYATIDADGDVEHKYMPGKHAEATEATLQGAWAASGNYYTGEIIPIGVTFSDAVSVGPNTTLTVNGVKCKPLCQTNIEGTRIPFGYTVTDDSPAQLNITAVNNIVNSDGAAVTIQPFEVINITSDNGVYLMNYSKSGTIDLDNAKYGIDEGKTGDQVATVLIPLKGTDAQKAWLSTETVALPDDTQLLMELPGYSSKQPITGYLAGGYFSYDLGKTRYPAYVVGEGSAIVTRFAVPQNMYGTVRKDTVSLYLEKMPIPDTDTTYGAWTPCC